MASTSAMTTAARSISSADIQTELGSNVEGGLPPIAVAYSTSSLADTPLSGASPLAQFEARLFSHESALLIVETRALQRSLLHTTEPNVGGGLPPMAMAHSTSSLADTPLSGASPLPQFEARLFSHGSALLIVETRALQRSLVHTTEPNVGGGLPPMAVAHSTSSLADTPLSGASPLPQFEARLFSHESALLIVETRALQRSLLHTTEPNVGGGLPPMAMAYSTSSLTDTPLSGGKPLPQFEARLFSHESALLIVETRALQRSLIHTTEPNVGGGLPPIAMAHSTSPLADTPLSGASPLPHLNRFTLEKTRVPALPR